MTDQQTGYPVAVENLKRKKRRRRRRQRRRQQEKV
jgi:hypothetical protein